MKHLMDPVAPPWQGLTTCPEWIDGPQCLEAPSPSPAVRYAVRQRMALESIAGGPGAIADLSPYALKQTPHRAERTEGGTTSKVHSDAVGSDSFAFPDQRQQGWPVELSDSNKIAESGFLALPETAQNRQGLGLANLMPKARGGSASGQRAKEHETTEAFTAAYATWGLDNDGITENCDRQIDIDSRPPNSISLPMALTATIENFAPV